MINRKFVLIPVTVLLLAGCGTVSSSEPSPTMPPAVSDSPAPTPTFDSSMPGTPQPSAEPEPPPEPEAWTTESAWDACYSAHLSEFPLSEGSTIDAYADSDVMWNSGLDGYVVHMRTHVKQGDQLVDGTRTCLVQGTPVSPNVTVNPVME